MDASGELLTIYLDVTLPALHQEAILSRDEVYSSARKAKAAAYPRKDSSGRLLNENFCVPFILTSMGGLCREGHDFLRLCKKRNKSATLHLLDVLVTQHARWTARRIRRALFGQSLVDFSGSSWSSVKIHKSAAEPTQVNRRKAKVSRMTREFSEVVAAEDTQPYQKASNCNSPVPQVSQYADSDTEMQDSDVEHVGDEDFLKADGVRAATSQRTEFFELSPK